MLCSQMRADLVDGETEKVRLVVAKSRLVRVQCNVIFDAHCQKLIEVYEEFLDVV